MEWYIIDVTTGLIVNVVTGPRTAEDALRHFDHGRYAAKREDDVPLDVLRSYRYWSVRP